MKKTIAVILVLTMCFSLFACGKRATENEETKPKEAISDVSGSSLRWPNLGICTLLPKPDADEGIVNYDSSESADIDVYNVSWDAYYQYVESCQEMGFTLDYYSSENSYEANNADGYSLWLYYDEEDQIMSISIYEPEDEVSSATDETEEAEDIAAAEDVEPTEAEEETEAPKESEKKEKLVDGMRPEFKEAMDSYEDFMDEYVAFMKKYNKNPGDLSLLLDYADYLGEYAEFVEDFEKWDDGEMNAAETEYYIKVQTRVSKKLLEVIE